MRGLIKMTAVANNIEARRDFFRLANQAINGGQVALVKKHLYPEGAGWRTIDKHIAKLRNALAASNKGETVNE